MQLRHTIDGVSYTFDSLKDLLAKATPLRSGDELAGLAASSSVQRIAARMALADLPLKAFLEHPIIPYESDEVTRLIVDTHSPEAFAPIASLTVGDLRDTLLSHTATGEFLAAIAPGLTPEMAAAVSKLMRAQDLIAVARKIHVVTRFRTTVGLPGRLSTRLQPNHPTDDPLAIAASILDGLLLGSGDAVIGINPVADNVQSTTRLLRLIDAVRRRYAIPTQSCVLAHLTTQTRRPSNKAPPSTSSFNPSPAPSRPTPPSASTSLSSKRQTRQPRPSTAPHPHATNPNVMYFETGQGSCLSANAHHGVDDQQTLEARAYAVARHFNPMLVNTVVGFIGPNTSTTASRSFAPASKTTSAASSSASPWAATSATPTTPKPTRTTWTPSSPSWAPPASTTSWASPERDDIMLQYQSTSFHDALYLRATLGLRPAPEFEAWLAGDMPHQLTAPHQPQIFAHLQQQNVSS